MAVYLIHLNEPLGHARHYSGYAKGNNPQKRIDKHGTAKGARMLKVAAERGISWVVAQIWPDADREFERSLKKRGQAAICPLCKIYRSELNKARCKRYREKKKQQVAKDHSNGRCN